jgi:hypothetical protein
MEAFALSFNAETKFLAVVAVNWFSRQSVFQAPDAPDAFTTRTGLNIGRRRRDTSAGLWQFALLYACAVDYYVVPGCGSDDVRGDYPVFNVPADPAQYESKTWNLDNPVARHYYLAADFVRLTYGFFGFHFGKGDRFRTGFFIVGEFFEVRVKLVQRVFQGARVDHHQPGFGMLESLQRFLALVKIGF